jgi:hypothetical protein
MSYDTNFFRPISVPAEVAKVNKNLSRVVRHCIKKGRLMNISLVKQKGWIAVPAQRYSHIILMDQEQLQRTFLARGYRKLLAVALDPMGTYPSVYVLPPTTKGIEAFHREWFSFNCTLFAGQPDWVIISTDSEFDVVAGSAEFVRQLLNCALNEAFLRFQAFVTNHPMEEQMRKHLYFVHDLLRDNYPSAEVGSEFYLIDPPI